MKVTLFVLCILLLLAVGASGQTYYTYQDSVAVGTDTTDVIFAAVGTSPGGLLRYATFKFEGGNGWLIVGAPDTTSWATRTEWLYMAAGETLTIGPNPSVRGVRAKMDSGTGVLYVFGLRTASQY